MTKERFSLHTIIVCTFMFIHGQLQSQPFSDTDNILIPSRCMVFYSVPLIDYPEANYYWFSEDKSKTELQILNETIYNGLTNRLIEKGQDLGILYNPDFKEQKKYNGDWYYYGGTDSSLNNAIKTAEEAYWKKLPSSIDSSALFDIYLPYFIDFVKTIPSKEVSSVRKIIADKIKERGLEAFTFIEEWRLESRKLSFDKKVIAYSFTINDGYFHIPVLIKPVLQPNKSDNEKKKELVKKFHYEYIFDGNKSRSAPYLNEYMQTSLVLYFYNLVRANKIDAHDFYSREKLNIRQIAEIMNFNPIFSTGDYLDVNPFPVRLVEPAYFTDEFKSIIFEENWYINPENLQFIKEVTGIAFVKHYYEENDIEKKNLRKKICFYVTLNKGN